MLYISKHIRTEGYSDALVQQTMVMYGFSRTVKLVFDKDERSPSDEFKVQFEALSQFDDEDCKVAKALLESLILKHNAKRAFVQG